MRPPERSKSSTPLLQPQTRLPEGSPKARFLYCSLLRGLLRAPKSSNPLRLLRGPPASSKKLDSFTTASYEAPCELHKARLLYYSLLRGPLRAPTSLTPLLQPLTRPPASSQKLDSSTTACIDLVYCWLGFTVPFFLVAGLCTADTDCL